MILFQTLVLREHKDEPLSELFDRLVSVLKDASYDLSRIRFTLEDSPRIVCKKSGVERVLNDYPELEGFKGSFVSVMDQSPAGFISNETPDQHLFPMEPGTLVAQASHGPIDPGVLSKILHRYPRTFPFFRGDIVFNEVDLFNLSEIPMQELPLRAQPNSLRRPNLRLSFTNAAGNRGQTRFLRAQIALSEPTGGKLLRFPPATDQLLDKIGPVSGRSVSIIPPSDETRLLESKITKGTEIAERFTGNPFHSHPGLHLPFQLPEVAKSSQFGVPQIERADMGIPSIRDLLKRELGLLEYRYCSKLSGRGHYVMSKISPHNNLLIYGADASPMGGQFSSALTIKLPHARFTIDIHLPQHGTNYPVNEHIPQVVSNSAFMTRHLEETFVSEIESLFGPSPAWFPSVTAFR